MTSPFVTSEIYDNAIESYFELDKNNFDSLMSVNKINKFLWDEKGPLNYDRKKEKWPRTQTLKNIYEINSAFFISEIKNYLLYKDRIGLRPYLFNLSNIQSLDIDWEDDFKMAEKIYSNEN